MPLISFTDKIHDADIAKIAGDLEDWQDVAKELGFGSVVIGEIEGNNKGVAQAKAFLRKWIANEGTNATYGKLSEVLMKLERQGAAEAMIRIAFERFHVKK